MAGTVKVKQRGTIHQEGVFKVFTCPDSPGRVVLSPPFAKLFDDGDKVLLTIETDGGA